MAGFDFYGDMYKNTSTAPESQNMNWNSLQAIPYATQSLYTYKPNGSGGINYFYGSTPIDNYVYGAATGKDYNAIQSAEKAKYSPATGGTGTSAINDTNSSGTYSGSYTGSGSSYDPSQLAVYDQGIGQLNTSLSRLPTQLQIALDNIGSQYGQNKNQLDSSFSASKNQYDTSGVQNQQQLRTNRNTITDQSSQGLRGLMRILGAHNALGSSDSLNASQAVQQAATAQNNGAGQTFAQNQQNLDTNWGNYQNEDKNKRAQLTDWRTQQENSARAQSDTTKQSVLNQLAQLASQRASYVGGNSTAAAQPYLDQANALSSSIDSLGKIAPTYTGSTPVYNTPSLSSYNTGSGDSIKTDTTSGYQNSPALAALLGINTKKQSLFNF